MRGQARPSAAAGAASREPSDRSQRRAQPAAASPHSGLRSAPPSASRWRWSPQPRGRARRTTPPARRSQPSPPAAPPPPRRQPPRSSCWAAATAGCHPASPSQAPRLRGPSAARASRASGRAGPGAATRCENAAQRERSFARGVLTRRPQVWPCVSSSSRIVWAPAPAGSSHIVLSAQPSSFFRASKKTQKGASCCTYRA